MQKEWQTVLKFLDCHRKKDPVFEPSAEEFTDGKDALELLIQWVINVCSSVVQKAIKRDGAFLKRVLVFKRLNDDETGHNLSWLSPLGDFMIFITPMKSLDLGDPK